MEETGTGARYKPSNTDYRYSGPVFKDETTKDLLAQLSDMKGLALTLFVMLIFSMSINGFIIYQEWLHPKATPANNMTNKEKLKAMGIGTDTLYINNKK